MKSRIIGAIAGFVCVFALVDIFKPATPYVFYNKSESAPIGWYRLTPNHAVKRDVMVAAFAPENARNMAEIRDYLPSHVPLIKTVWAAAGDEICSEDGRITAPNRPNIYAEAQDAFGRIMPVWRGCITLSENQYFLVSTHVQNSWDSRYFGPVEKDDILGVVQYLGFSETPAEAGDGRARGKGADGKIKARSAPLGLFPCLHIFFGSAMRLCGGASDLAEMPGLTAVWGSAPYPDYPATSGKPA
ncbi:S26 family signal peptidase [Parasphingorhabdus sp. DH2-15]|uniref:S26 family signal peptidase n=1 Tax=Parasphingorhabdus sp. DH2-15 TaxID=3444112 RepID=UPI003F68645E